MSVYKLYCEQELAKEMANLYKTFAGAYEDQKPETPKSDDCSWPFPEGGEAQNLPT